MTQWRIRDFHEDDLDAAVRLWDDPAAGTAAPVFGVSDLISAVRAGAPAVMAVVGEELVGTVVATFSGARAQVMRSQLAGRLGLVALQAVILFGPPGTGKTTFAKGVASRLGWPFVELFPSRLAGDSPPVWRPRCGKSSRWWPSWTRWSYSSMRWKR